VSNFSTVVVCDFEYEVAAGDLPDVLCMVAQVMDENLQHLQTIKLWRGEFSPQPPFDIRPNAKREQLGPTLAEYIASKRSSSEAAQ
jgi:hypothetical protein